jgi:hypothetical protein
LLLDECGRRLPPSLRATRWPSGWRVNAVPLGAHLKTFVVGSLPISLLSCERTPVQDRLAVGLSNGRLEVLYAPCTGEAVSAITLAIPRGAPEQGATNDSLLWRITAAPPTSDFTSAVIGDVPPTGFATSLPLNENPPVTETLVVRVSSSVLGDVGEAFTISELQEGRFLTPLTRDNVTRAEFDHATGTCATG